MDSITLNNKNKLYIIHTFVIIVIEHYDYGDQSESLLLYIGIFKLVTAF